MESDNKNCILFFVKYPAPGKVKTRLAKELGSATAVELYRNFTLDILDTLQNLNINFKIVFDPPDTRILFQKWLGKNYSYAPQIGQDLGQKMKNAFQQGFSEGFNKVVLIGSDSPDLPEVLLRSALSVLETHDVVIGPASDGGYYLIGFSQKAFLPEVFEGICWSSHSVSMQTINILKKYLRRPYLLPLWHDVDTLDDLKSLVARNKNTAFEASRTFRYLTANKLLEKSDVRL